MSKIEKLPMEILENSEYNFSIEEDGLYLIEIIASAKSWWQNLKKLRAFFNDDDLAIKMDGIEFSKLNGKKGLFDGEAAWNGNNLKGLKKSGLFIVELKSGDHKINFIPNEKPYLHSIKISKIEQNETVKYVLAEENKKAQDGNNRQWVNLVFIDLSIKEITITAKAEKREKDSDDIKLIIDGEIQQNPNSKKFKNWYWCGSLDKGKEKEFNKQVNLPKGLHYIELWADRMPTLASVSLKLKFEEKEAEREAQEPERRIPTIDDPKWTGDFNDDTEQMILARAIFGEARSTLSSDEARIAVGWTIRNRVELQALWGKNYHEVILKPGHYSCFTKTDENYELVVDPLSAKSIVDRKSWPRCYDIAGKILNNEISDPVSGATCYHDISISQEKFVTEVVPNAKFIKKIDRLMFYYSPN